MSLQFQGRIQEAPIFNTDGSINAGCVGLFAVGPCGADDVAIRRAATVKISTALQHHHPYLTAPSSVATQVNNKKRGGKTVRVVDREKRVEDSDDNHDAPEDEAEGATAEVNKFYPMKASPQALRCE